MSDEDLYTAEQLAALAGVTLRTVRYYVQEGLIDRPEARGPGPHFTNKHLRQLKRCQLLQDWGFDLETIRDKAGSFQSVIDSVAPDSAQFDRTTLRAVLQAMTGDESGLTKQHAFAVRTIKEHLRGKSSKTSASKTSEGIEPGPRMERITMAEGIDLVVDTTAYDIPSPKALIDIGLLIRKSFDPLKKRDDEEE